MSPNRPFFARAALCLLLTAPLSAAHAATTTFSGGGVANCNYTPASKTYVCSALPLPEWDSKIAIADGYTVQVTGNVALGYNNGLTMSGTAKLQSTTGSLDIGDINPANLSITGGTLQAQTQFKMGSQAQTITANIIAATMNLGGGSAIKITGSLTATGTINIPSHAVIIGPISGGDINTNSPVTITGNVTSTGNFELASGSTVTGNVTAVNVTLNPSPSKVIGNVTASNHVDIGSGSGIQGNITADSATLRPSEAYVTGTAAVNTIQLGYHGTIQQGITCQAGDCSCITNNSDYPASCTPSTPPVNGLDHILIEYNGSQLSCAPQVATITACADGSCATKFTGGLTVKFVSNLIPNVVIGASGVATFTPPFDAGATTLNLQTSVPGSAKTQCDPAGCQINWVRKGLTISAPHHKAGETVDVSIQIRDAGGNGTTCTPLPAMTRDVNLTCDRNNPLAGTVWPKMGVNSATAECKNTSTLTLSLPFDSNGLAKAKLMYEDVGEVRVSGNYVKPNPQGGTYSGESPDIVVAPYSFKFTTTGLTTPSFPAPTGSSAQAFAKVNQSVPVRIYAVNKAGNRTPSFGNESPVEKVRLTSELSAPVGGVAGIFTADNDYTFTNGASDEIPLAWDQVGLRKLTAKLKNTGGYLNAGTNLIAEGEQLARFVPDRFVVKATADVAGMWFQRLLACADAATCEYVFSQQPFLLSITAVDGANQPMQNYSGTFPLQPTVVALKAQDADNVAANRNPSYITAPGTGPLFYTDKSNLVQNGIEVTPDGDWLNGVWTKTLNYKLSGKVGPTSAWFRASSADATSRNSVTPTASGDGRLRVVYGRALVENNYGSPQLKMPVKVRAQYYSGTGNNYLNSTLTVRSDLPLPPAAAKPPVQMNTNAVFVKCERQLATDAAGTCNTGLVKLDGTPVYDFQNGIAQFRLDKPNASGSVVMTATPFSFLEDPAPQPGQLTFGVYKSGPVIYMREVY
ncbi:DUF6701 domain-containing protein [Massilia sp. SM-13]|uniref:DUF6701 domain-containing protein n=1 Tax=Pseudoduganella rhizocola TaxID=3382643 RepID=UPI0038B42256